MVRKEQKNKHTHFENVGKHNKKLAACRSNTMDAYDPFEQDCKAFLQLILVHFIIRLILAFRSAGDTNLLTS